jgi:lysophospholipase L1-like esterase
MAVSKSINGGKECFKGGMQTGWMLKNFRERFFDKDDKGNYKLKQEYQNGAVKKVVIEGGFNDITSLKSVESVKQNLSAIYQLAREAGLTIVASTYFDWDAKKGVEIFRRDFEKHKWGEYPLSPEELQKRIQDLNQWVLSQHDPANGFTAIDLQTEMSDHEKYPRADFVHPSGKGSKAMAAYIKEKGGIVDEEN